ncbi:hypothetical protein HOLleu_04513 [Holothuria leucospilota]|uniref:Uncharacterized protein n=1 Tax=Holothuria leucospilota TaxID=206669 RepID=A0A9Q1CTD9_HOLLE|nr:hypothetical protein HOLleu_04513 [Holothuria leucospilota]
MENSRLHLMALLATCLLLTRYCLSAEDKEPCNSPQNGTIGGVGIIQCLFKCGDYKLIVWSYAEGDTEPLVRYGDSVLQSPGHENNSYSLRIDGSLLIIDAASRTGSKKYKVETFDSDGHPNQSQIVEYHFMGESTAMHHRTTVSPITCPIIDTPSSGKFQSNVMLHFIASNHDGNFFFRMYKLKKYSVEFSD